MDQGQTVRVHHQLRYLRLQTSPPLQPQFIWTRCLSVPVLQPASAKICSVVSMKKNFYLQDFVSHLNSYTHGQCLHINIHVCPHFHMFCHYT